MPEDRSTTDRPGGGPSGDRGERADSPVEIPSRGWLDVAKRVKARVKEENAVLLAAGVAFFGMFAVFPALVAVVSLYGLVADPSDVQSQIDDIASSLPDSTRAFLQEQLGRIVDASTAGLGFALVASVAVALWSASSGVGHLIEAINAAYAEPSESFIKAKLRALVLALGAVVVVVVMIGALTVLPALAGQVSETLRTVALWVRWPLIALVMVVVLAVLYRSGPNREDPKWRWTSAGGLVATMLWLLSSVALAIYASQFAKLDATYGSFGGVLVVMLWLLLSVLSILIGAYLNAELEHQTERDSTTGPCVAHRRAGGRDGRSALTHHRRLDRRAPSVACTCRLGPARAVVLDPGGRPGCPAPRPRIAARWNDGTGRPTAGFPHDDATGAG